MSCLDTDFTSDITMGEHPGAPTKKIKFPPNSLKDADLLQMQQICVIFKIHISGCNRHTS